MTYSDYPPIVFLSPAFSFFLGFFFYASVSIFLHLLYFGVIVYGDHEYSKKDGNFIKAVYSGGCLGCGHLWGYSVPTC